MWLVVLGWQLAYPQIPLDLSPIREISHCTWCIPKILKWKELTINPSILLGDREEERGLAAAWFAVVAVDPSLALILAGDEEQSPKKNFTCKWSNKPCYLSPSHSLPTTIQRSSKSLHNVCSTNSTLEVLCTKMDVHLLNYYSSLMAQLRNHENSEYKVPLSTNRTVKRLGSVLGNPNETNSIFWRHVW